MSIKFHGFLSAEYNMLGNPLFRKLKSVEMVLFKKNLCFFNFINWSIPSLYTNPTPMSFNDVSL